MRAIIIGVINAMVPGLGYLIIKKRQVFGSLILGNTLITYAWMLSYPGTLTPGMWGPLETNSSLGLLAVALLFAAFGYDAYKLASEN